MFARIFVLVIAVTRSVSREVYEVDWSQHTTDDQGPPERIQRKPPNATENVRRPQQQQEKIITEDDVNRFQQNIRMFAAAVLLRIEQQNKDQENIFFSPLSISHAMGMVNAGARNNTSSQIKRVLRQKANEENSNINALFKNITDDKFGAMKGSDVVTLMAARGYFNQGYDIYPSFSKILQDFYHSDGEIIDFSNAAKATRIINSWVAKHTKNLIKELVTPNLFTSLTRFVLVNALYFKAPWPIAFRELAPDSFTTPKGSVLVPYLFSKRYFKTMETEKFIYVGIPYTDLETHFIIIMPKTDKAMREFMDKRNLPSYFKTFSKRLANWDLEKIALSIPKFAVEKKIDVKKILQAMGVKDLFSYQRADLGGISKEFVYVSDFVHKARITINKDGTEAAAATAVLGSARRLDRVRPVTINRPFIYAVYQRGDILFLGKMVNPNGK